MNLRIWYNLRKTRNDLTARSVFKRELNSTLMTKFDELYGKPSVWHSYVWVRTTRIFLAGTIGFSMVGTSAYAYNSPSVTEGSLLYPVKIGIEKVEEKTKTTTEEKVKFLIKQAERRDAEREVLVKKFKIKITENDSTNEFVYTTETPSSTFNEVASFVSSTSPSSTEQESVDADKIIQRGESNKSERKERSEKRSVETEKKIREKFTHEVKKTEEKIEDVEQKLIEVRSKLGNDESDEKIKKIIEDRFEKKKEKERFESEREEKKEDEKNENKSGEEREGGSREQENENNREND